MSECLITEIKYENIDSTDIFELPNVKHSHDTNRIEKNNLFESHIITDDIIRAVENESVHCTECDELFENTLQLGKHSIQHSDCNKYTCHMCSYKRASWYQFELHIKAHEGKTKYKCEICNKAFTVSTHAVEHKYFHTGEKPFKCDICGKNFMYSWFLSSHRRSQHFEIVTGMPLVKYDCVECNKHYTSSTGLKKHQLSKHNINQIDVSVLCDVCGKRLANKEKLKFHKRIHTGNIMNTFYLILHIYF